MSKPVKIVSLILVILLVAGAVFGVAYISTSYEPPAPKVGIYVDKELVEDPGVMLTVGTTPVSFEDYRYYYLTNKYMLAQQNGDPNYYESDYDGYKAKELRDATEQYILQQTALLQLAAEKGITLSDEEKAEIAKSLEDQKASLGASFTERLSASGYTGEAMYLRISEQQRLAGKAYTAMMDELTEEAKKELEKSNITAKHILLGFDTAAADPAANEEEVLEKATEMYEEITKSDDPAAKFDELMNTFSEDPGLASNPDGYTFGKGEMMPEFEEGAYALEEGEISEPVRTSYGYHIIMRVPLDMTQLDAAAANKASTDVMTKLTEMTDSLTVTPGAYYADVAPDAIV